MLDVIPRLQRRLQFNGRKEGQATGVSGSGRTHDLFRDWKRLFGRISQVSQVGIGPPPTMCEPSTFSVTSRAKPQLDGLVGVTLSRGLISTSNALITLCVCGVGRVHDACRGTCWSAVWRQLITKGLARRISRRMSREIAVSDDGAVVGSTVTKWDGNREPGRRGPQTHLVVTCAVGGR